MNLVPVIEQLWDAWNVRAMILLSLVLQIILFILGYYRQYTYKSRKGILLWIFLWLAYIIADWVTTATLGKLSITCLLESAPSNFLRGFWASLLLLHLGGPDTITAYALEDNLLWTRHLLTLVFQVGLALYVVVYSWTKSRLSLLNIPLLVAGIIKCGERTWCLFSATSTDFGRAIPFFYGSLDYNDAVWNKSVGAKKVVLAHRWFALNRPDMRNHFSPTGNRASSAARVVSNLQETVDLKPDHSVYYHFLIPNSPREWLFHIAEIELGLMFDMLYTKSAIIYTMVGSVLRLISFCCSSFVLVFFSISFINTGKRTEQYWSNIDIWITEILLVGAVVSEICGLLSILYSDWFVVLRYRYRNICLLGRLFRYSLPKEQKETRWSGHMGQFNLASYCLSFRNRNKCWFKMCDEMVLKYRHTSSIPIPESLKEPDNFPQVAGDQQQQQTSYHFTKGQRALESHGCEDMFVKGSLTMDLGAAIMIWHIATDILYPGPASDYAANAGNIRTCKIISDYMMYLLSMKPSMVSNDSNMWFDSVSRWLIKKRQLYNNTDIYELPQETEDLDPPTMELPPQKLILRPALYIAGVLREMPDALRSNVLKSVWLEMMHYAAMCCPTHLQERSQGSEILTIYWLLATFKVYFNFVEPAPSQLNVIHEANGMQGVLAEDGIEN